MKMGPRKANDWIRRLKPLLGAMCLALFLAAAARAQDWQAPSFLKELELVLAEFPVEVLDLSMDADHNRADCTFLGAPDAVEECAAAVTARAVELIDMRQHSGSHPRMGAVDVVPFVPISGLAMDDAVEIAHRCGRSFAERHGISVFFYEEACTSEGRRNLSDVRRGEYEGMAAKLQDPDWAVDAGPQAFNQRSGVTAVGARMPLVAFNVNLSTDDLAVAKAIATAVRHSSGGLRYVKAMGLDFGAARTGVAVSDPTGTLARPLCVVERAAEEAGLEVVTTESAQGLTTARAIELIVGAKEDPQFGPAILFGHGGVAVEVLLDRWEPSPAVRPAPLPARPVAAAGDVEEAARLLARARRPVIAVESAGRDPAAFAALVELAELLAIPVVEPQSAVCSSFPRTSPLHAGGELAPLAADADLVVLVGCRSPWYPPSAKPGQATVLVIDEMPHRPHMAYQVLTADHYVGGDLAAALGAITARLRADGASRNAPDIQARRQELEAGYAEADGKRQAAERRALSAGDGPVDPVAVAAALRDLPDGDALVTDETITHSRVLAQHLMADAPGRYRYVQGGLGQGLGVALGVQLAQGRAGGAGGGLTVLTVGDGSWLYNPVLPGLMASSQYGLPVLVVVFNNRQYLSMKFNHLRAYPQGAAVRTGNFHGVDLSAQPDAAAVAIASGAVGLTVASTPELVPALSEAITAGPVGRARLGTVHPCQ